MLKIVIDGNRGEVMIKGSSVDIIEEYVKASTTLLEAVSHNIDVPEKVLYKLMAETFEGMAAGRVHVVKDSTIIDVKAVKALKKSMRGSDDNVLD